MAVCASVAICGCSVLRVVVVLVVLMSEREDKGEMVRTEMRASAGRGFALLSGGCQPARRCRCRGGWGGC